MTITLESAVLLGTTVPEPSRTDERIYVCSAWWHDDFGLLRIYPLGKYQPPRRWNLYDIKVERNPRDSRNESWTIAGDRTAPDINRTLINRGKLQQSKRGDLIGWARRKHLPTSIAEANDKRASLALIEPQWTEIELEHNADSPDSPQLKLFDAGLPPSQGAKRFPYIPRVRFNDGSDHRLMLRDWGVYEQMRKHPGREREMDRWLHLGPKSALLVGNLNNQRNAWVVISVLNVRNAQMSLLECA